ncbi:MAG: hypothetical protein NZ930_01165 [Candidatus Bipolaricaulota bacterium]|nr:hypothetical protein [Candidatus Bipolaricaulota bacterium]MDW8031312.1 hypothetical protein [Candidatus Bipolaricaulota bacterium]
MARKKHKHAHKEHPALEKKLDALVTSAVTRVQDFWQRNKLIIRAWTVFALVIGAFTTLLFFLNLYTGFEAWLNCITALMLAGALWLLGANGQAVGTVVTSKIFSAEIITECTAIFPLMIFLAAVIAYPSGWRKKLWGIVLGAPAILLRQYHSAGDAVLYWLLVPQRLRDGALVSVAVAYYLLRWSWLCIVGRYVMRELGCISTLGCGH